MSTVPRSSASRADEQELILAECSSRLGEVLQSFGHERREAVESMHEALCRAVFLHPQLSALRVMRGVLFLHESDFQAAIRNFRHALAIEPRNKHVAAHLAAAQFGHGMLLESQGLREEALLLYNQACVLTPENTKFRLRQCHLLVHLQQLSTAAQCLSAIVDATEHDVQSRDVWSEAIILRCRVHLQLQASEDAVADASKLLQHAESAPSQVGQLYRAIASKARELSDRGTALLLSGRTAGATQIFRTAIVLSRWVHEHTAVGGGIEAEELSLLPNLLWQRARAHRLQRQFDDALRDIEDGMTEVETILAEHMGAQTDIASVSANLSHPDSASSLALWESLKRELSLTLNELAIRCYEEEKYEQAAHCLSRCIDLSPYEPGYLMSRGDALSALGHVPAAIQDFEKAYQLVDTTGGEQSQHTSLYKALAARLGMAHLEIGRRLFNITEYHEALEAFQRALLYQPQNGTVLDRIDQVKLALRTSTVAGGSRARSRSVGPATSISALNSASVQRRLEALQRTKACADVAQGMGSSMHRQGRRTEFAHGTTKTGGVSHRLYSSTPDLRQWFGTVVSEERNTALEIQSNTATASGRKGTRSARRLPAAPRHREQEQSTKVALVRQALLHRWLQSKQSEFRATHVYHRNRSKEVLKGHTPHVLAGWKRVDTQPHVARMASGAQHGQPKANSSVGRLVLPSAWEHHPKPKRVVKTFIPVQHRAPFGPAYLPARIEVSAGSDTNHRLPQKQKVISSKKSERNDHLALMKQRLGRRKEWQSPLSTTIMKTK